MKNRETSELVNAMHRLSFPSIIRPARLLLVLGGGCFCACTAGAEETSASTPAAYKAGKATQGNLGAAGNWWQLFGDKTLSGLLHSVSVSNQSVKGAEAAIRQSQAALKAARAGYFPTLDAFGSRERTKASGVGDLGFSVLQRDTVGTGFQTAYEVDLWGKVRGGVAAAKSELLASQAARDGLTLSLQGEVASAYFLLRAADGELATLQATVKQRAEALKLTQAKQESGTGNDLDIERAKSELASSEADVFATQEQRNQIENSLALLLGKPAPDFHLAAESGPEQPPLVPSGLPSELLKRRPDIAQAELALAAARARVGVAKAAFFPALHLTANSGWQANEAKRLTDKEADNWGMGLQFTIPLFDGGRRQAAVESSKAGAESTESAYHQTVLTALQEVENTLSGVANVGKQREALDRALTSARNAAKLSRSRYDGGLVSYFEVIDADRTVLQLERGAAQLRGQHFRNVANLIKALGGGWTK